MSRTKTEIHAKELEGTDGLLIGMTEQKKMDRFLLIRSSPESMAFSHER